jgi:hypothetical protein
MGEEMAEIQLVVHVAGPLDGEDQHCVNCGAPLHPQDVGRWNEGFRVVEYQADDPREQRRVQLLPHEPIPEGARTCNGQA